MAGSLYDFEILDAQKKTVAMKQFQGKLVLVVNVASKCGFTPQYKGLQELHEKYADKGLVILGFPCNQFGAQEPGSNQEILEFCELNYSVKFPIMDKVDVNGKNEAPLFGFLKSSAPGLLGTEAIKWNFTKFLIGKDGKVIERFAPTTEPSEIEKVLQKYL